MRLNNSELVLSSSSVKQGHMKEFSPQEITQLLQSWRGGERGALEQLIPRVYDELHQLAHRYMRQERPGHLCQTTALVNEVYLRLWDARRIQWHDRAHFFAMSAKLMRRILVEYARSRQSLKRGGRAEHVALEEAMEVLQVRDEDVLAVDAGLSALNALDPRKAEVVELRIFGGLSVEEAAEALGVSRETVLRDCRLAKAWLRREMNKAVRSDK
jgi:RNA polymerase sigma-70 factor (ECF subfamily)